MEDKRKFTKEQLKRSILFCGGEEDLLEVILEADKQYTKKQAKRLVEEYKKRSC